MAYTYITPKLYRDKKTNKPYIKLGKKKKFLNTNMSDEELLKYVKKNFKVKRKVKKIKKKKDKKAPSIVNKIVQKVTVKTVKEKNALPVPEYHRVNRLDPDVVNLVNKIRTGDLIVKDKPPEPVKAVPPEPLPASLITPPKASSPTVISSSSSPALKITPNKSSSTVLSARKLTFSTPLAKSVSSYSDDLNKYTEAQLDKIYETYKKTLPYKEKVTASVRSYYGIKGKEKKYLFLKSKGLVGEGNNKNIGGGLWTDQIIEVMSKVPSFIGCIASDQFEDLINKVDKNKKFGWITNLDPSTKEGSHWVAFVVNPTDEKPDANSIMYFDPFGDDIPDNMLEGLKDIADKVAPDKMLKLKVNRVKHQDVSTNNCGFHSMNFLLDILTRNKSFADATGFNDKIQDKSKEYESKIEQLKTQAPFKYINMQDGKGVKEVVQKVADKVKSVVSNIKDRIMALFKGVSGSVQLRKFLEKHGQDNIKKITVGRQPIMGIIRKTLNLISLGKLEKSLKELKYDELYHLFIVVQLDKGGSYHIEKNQRIEVYSGGIKGESIEVPLKRPINVLEFFEKTKRRMGANFYKYTPDFFNCQNFINNLLSSNGLNNERIRKFVNQDTQSLFKKMPEYVKIIGRTVTDVAGRVDEAVKGKGKEIKSNE